MTPSEFASRIRSKYPGQYDDMGDPELTNAVLNKHPEYGDMLDKSTTVPGDDPKKLEQVPGMKPGEYPSDLYTTFAPNANLVQLGQAGVGLAKALPELTESGINALKGALPNPSLKGLGASASQLSSPIGQDLAQAAKTYGTTAQPEIGQLVAKAGQSAEEGLSTSPAQASIFEQPIVEGVARPAKEMMDLVQEHNKQIGEAIGNTLKGLEKSGTPFDPKPIIDQAESMLKRNVDGEIMTTGVQGETNDAIQEALSSLKDYSKGKAIPWSDANEIKGALQNSANYKAKAFDEANEAYKNVAKLIKNGIDDQATGVLKQTGGNIEDFQNLRNAYQKTTVLKDMLTNATKKEMMQPSTPEAIVNSVKHYLPHALGLTAVYETMKHLF